MFHKATVSAFQELKQVVGSNCVFNQSCLFKVPEPSVTILRPSTIYNSAALPLSTPSLLGFQNSALSFGSSMLGSGQTRIFSAHLSPGPATASLSGLPFSHPATLLFTDLQNPASIGPSYVLDVSMYLSYLYLTHSYLNEGPHCLTPSL